MKWILAIIIVAVALYINYNIHEDLKAKHDQFESGIERGNPGIEMTSDIKF
jgi:hypothetical protein